MIPFVYLSLFLGLLHTTFADTITARAFLGCTQVLSSRIHCYGGQAGAYMTIGRFANPTPDHFYLDLSEFDYTAVGSAKNNWTTVTGSIGSNYLTPNSFHLVTSILNKSKFILYGGASSSEKGSMFMTVPVLLYDPASNTWSSIPTYGQYTNNGAIVDLSGSQTLWTWGGKINNTGILTRNQIANLNYGRGIWSVVEGESTNNNIRLSYTATLASSNNRIYIIGGFEGAQLSTTNSPDADMLSVRWYDTLSQTWGVDRATVSNGQSITARGYHTTTQIPGTTTFLVYGGSTFINNQNDVHADYAYLYDYSQSVYTPLDFKDDGPGRLSGHCAILYEKNIFILFGFNEKFVLQNDIHVLDVSNPSQLVWRSSTNPTSPQQPPPGSKSTNNGGSMGNGDDQISTAAIAGIVVGAAVFLAIVGAAIFYFCYYKRRNQFRMENPMYPNATDFMLPTAFPDQTQDSSPQPLSGSTTTVMDKSRPLSGSTSISRADPLSLSTATDTVPELTKPTSDGFDEMNKPYSDACEQPRFNKLYSDAPDGPGFNKLYSQE